MHILNVWSGTLDRIWEHYLGGGTYLEVWDGMDDLDDNGINLWAQEEL